MANALGRVCVTGATGKAGLATVLHLREHGYEVVATDIALSRDDAAAGVLAADLTDYGQATEVLRGTDAVVHLANIPAPGRFTPGGHVHRQHDDELQRLPRRRRARPVRRGVGVQRDHARPAVRPRPASSRRARRELLSYAPVDEDHFPFPATTYALSKVASETIAEHISRWSGIAFIGLRISNIMEPRDYERFPSYWPDPHARKWNLWGYVDVRDVAAACRLGLEADVAGSQNVIIAAADTVMNRPSRDLLAEVFPDIPLTGEVAEFGSLLSTARASGLIGYQPRHSWRDHLRPANEGRNRGKVARRQAGEGGAVKLDLEAAKNATIPDVLPAPGDPFRVLFTGINPGLYSAATGWHFARPGNRFWPALHASGFTPRLLAPSEQAELTRYGLGITNIAPRATAQAAELTARRASRGRRPAARARRGPPPRRRRHRRRHRLPHRLRPAQGPPRPPARTPRRRPALDPPEPQRPQRLLDPPPPQPRPSASCAKPSTGISGPLRPPPGTPLTGRLPCPGPPAPEDWLLNRNFFLFFLPASNPVSLLAPYLYRQMLGAPRLARPDRAGTGPRWKERDGWQTPRGCECPRRPGWPRAWAARPPWRSSPRRAQAGAAVAAPGGDRRPSGASGSGSGATVITTATTSAGTVLTDGSGRAVYLWVKDTGNTSACSGACAGAWPPVTTTGTVTASGSASRQRPGHDHQVRRHQAGDLRRAPAVLLRRRLGRGDGERPGQ